MRWREVRAASSDVLNTSFAIPGRSNIPSDETSHKVVIQVLYLQASVEWICIPKKQQSVFLRVSELDAITTLDILIKAKCNVVNTSEFTLLAGAARVFLNSNFIAKSYIEVRHLVLSAYLGNFIFFPLRPSALHPTTSSKYP